MNAFLTASALAVVLVVLALSPGFGPAAVALCAACALVAGLVISRLGTDKEFLLRLFVAGLIARMLVGTIIFNFHLQEFFGGDAFTYDYFGTMVMKMWRGEIPHHIFLSIMGPFLARNYGMIYVTGAIYWVTGQNMLAAQFFNAVIGAATAPVIYLCARHLFRNVRVARVSAQLVAFFPSLVLWSSQGLKDGPMIFLLALAMLATLKLDERFSLKHLAVLVAALGGILSLRFYVFYMMAAAVVGAFAVGFRTPSVAGYVRRLGILFASTLLLLQLGVLNSATEQFELYGNLKAVQRSRADQAESASGFKEDTDVSTTEGALTVIPLGFLYLLFAPFPWQLASLRQSITLPEMVVWWASFPLLCAGLWFTLKHRMRQALPVLIFTMMLTLAYSVFQGNVGTAYRQRSQLLVFYFIFVSVGYELLRERQEDKVRERAAAKAELVARLRGNAAHVGTAAVERDTILQPASAIDAGTGEARPQLL
ncbi:MAG: glycosyltransferase family 39 protein [Pyrinomonadaceae bacterium]